MQSQARSVSVGDARLELRVICDFVQLNQCMNEGVTGIASECLSLCEGSANRKQGMLLARNLKSRLQSKGLSELADFVFRSVSGMELWNCAVKGLIMSRDCNACKGHFPRTFMIEICTIQSVFFLLLYEIYVFVPVPVLAVVMLMLRGGNCHMYAVDGHH